MENKLPLGFVYYLQNPITSEIFYVGATEISLKNRWELFSSLNIEIQDIVQSSYESKKE